MTAFVVRDASHLGVDRIATSPTAFALYENLKAVLEKDATAVTAGWVLANSYVVAAMIADGNVTELKIQAGCIGQGRLRTTTGDVTTTSDALTNLTLPGGEYGFYPNTGGDAPSSSAQISLGLSGSGGLRANIALTDNGSGGAARARQRYFQASPPYNLGDGDVPIFMFAILDGSGNLIATYTAEDPPWANNGPTIIRPDGYLPNGNGYRLVRPRVDRQKLLDPATRGEELEKLRVATPQAIEITQEIKQADMALIPHPFLDNDLTGKTIVLLDPVSPMIHRLHEMHLSGEFPSEILTKGYLQLDNIPLKRAVPPGVMPVNVRWKTGG